MRLLIVGKWYPPVRGGIESHVEALARAMAPHHQVRVVVHNAGLQTVRETVDGVELIRVGTVAQPLNQPISPGVFRAMHGFAPDVVHVHAPNIWASLAALTMPRDVPIIVTHHADILGREPARSLAMAPYRALVRRSRFVVVSQLNNRTFSKDLGRTPTDHRVIPFCVWPSPHQDEPAFLDEARDLRREMFADDPVAVFVGRLVPYKGAETMIEALASVPRLRIVIVGDGPLRRSLENQAERLGLSACLHFAGAVDDRTKDLFLAACDFYVMPSVTVAEAFGITQVEAMYWSKPVIVTDLASGAPQVGKAGETSLVAPPRDVPALAEAMRRLTEDADLRRRLGEAGRRRAEDLYSVERFTAAYLQLYADAAAGRQRPSR